MLQKIRILIYTDHFDLINGEGPVGISDLIRFIRHKTKGVFDVEITSLNRHLSLVTNQPAHAANPLSYGLLSAFDELWIFGTRQINIPNSDPAKAQPHNELETDEIAALEAWMNAGGGLLFTGDHSEPSPLPNATPLGCMEPRHESFLTLGRALGESIPRAKQLRVWQGPPTNCTIGPLEDRENVNTQVEGSCTLGLDALCHQLDEIPQTLLPPSSQHPLFQYLNSKNEIVAIEVLPDHAHEGTVLVPEKLDDTWPSGSALPVVVARGFDKRPFSKRREYDLVVAYDGHPFNVGRIVADSSFHHFLDLNLAGLVGRECCGTPIANTHLDHIAYYFSNLVNWLAPRPKRDTIKLELLFRLAKHRDVLEARGGDITTLAQAAQSVAAAEWGNTNLYQLFGTPDPKTVPDVFEDPLSMTFFENPISAEFNLRSPILGGIMLEYHDFFRRENIHSPDSLKKDPTPPDVIVKGISRAFADEAEGAETRLASFRESVARLRN